MEANNTTSITPCMNMHCLPWNQPCIILLSIWFQISWWWSTTNLCRWRKEAIIGHRRRGQVDNDYQWKSKQYHIYMRKTTTWWFYATGNNYFVAIIVFFLNYIPAAANRWGQKGSNVRPGRKGGGGGIDGGYAFAGNEVGWDYEI